MKLYITDDEYFIVRSALMDRAAGAIPAIHTDDETKANAHALLTDLEGIWKRQRMEGNNIPKLHDIDINTVGGNVTRIRIDGMEVKAVYKAVYTVEVGRVPSLLIEIPITDAEILGRATVKKKGPAVTDEAIEKIGNAVADGILKAAGTKELCQKCKSSHPHCIGCCKVCKDHCNAEQICRLKQDATVDGGD